MEKLEKRFKGRVRNGLTATALAGTLAFGNGCVSLGARPHTTGENLWFGVATAAHAVDFGTTRYALSKGFSEGNTIYGKDPSTEKMMLIKSTYLGLTYGLGELYPEKRDLFYKISTVAGAVPFLWNFFQILTNSQNE